MYRQAKGFLRRSKLDDSPLWFDAFDGYRRIDLRGPGDTKRGEVCYEPFSSSGSQIIAGETTGRRVFAIEISPQYVDVAVRRWQTLTGRVAMLDQDGRTFEAVAAERLRKAA